MQDKIYLQVFYPNEGWRVYSKVSLSSLWEFKYLKMINKNTLYIDGTLMYFLSLNEVEESQWFFGESSGIYKELQILKETMIDILGSQYKLDGTSEYIKEQKDNIRVVYAG